jgi:hypothetical protein
LQELSEHERNLSDLFNGRFSRNKVLLAAEIPFPVTSRLRWQARGVNISTQDAEKIRFHKSHGMSSAKAMKIIHVIAGGDYYLQSGRGSDLHIYSILHDIHHPQKAYFLALKRDEGDCGIYLRTFYYSRRISRNVLKGGQRLLNLSGNDYFKGVCEAGPTVPESSHKP